MERLTHKKEVSRRSTGQHPTDYTSHYTFQQVVARLAAYEDTGLEPEEISELLDANEVSPEAKYAINEHADNLIKHLDALVHKDDSELKKYLALGSLDRLKELVQAERDGRLVVLPCKIVYELVWDVEKERFCISKCACKQEHIDQIGKTVFLTREEAEAALAEKGAENA